MSRKEEEGGEQEREGGGGFGGQGGKERSSETLLTGELKSVHEGCHPNSFVFRLAITE